MNELVVYVYFVEANVHTHSSFHITTTQKDGGNFWDKYNTTVVLHVDVDENDHCSFFILALPVMD